VNSTNTAETVTFYVSADNFVGNGGNAINLSDSGTVTNDAHGTDVSMSWYDNKNNKLGPNPLGTEIDSKKYDGVPPTGMTGSSGSYSDNLTGSLDFPGNDPSNFSMTEILQFLIPPGGTIDSATITMDLTDVPEPASLLLFGTGIFGIVVARQLGRRKKSDGMTMAA
jgi:hypothetical protein